MSGFSRTAGAADALPIKYGYAAITWGADIVKAMEDISAVGFRAIQLRGEAFAQFGDKPKALRELLDKHRLTFAVLSSGNLSIDPAREQEMLTLHTQHAQFVKDAGGLYLQVIDERPKGRDVVPDDYRRLGRLMTELGKRTGNLGVPLGLPPSHEQHGREAARSRRRAGRRRQASRAAAVRRRSLSTGRRRSGAGDPHLPRLD